LVIELGDKRYEARFGDFTAVDAGDFRQAVGFPLAAVFSGQAAFDIDVVAGLVWLLRRRKAKGLAYRAVAAEVTYDNFTVVDDDDEGGESQNGEKADPDPET
jgi:hypothetical protein